MADEAITGLQLMCGQWAELLTMPGRAIQRHHVERADALLLRSVTRADEDLLGNSAVSFVGTATIGTDHVDRELLKQRGIGFAYAPGCNANAVVDYVMAVILASRSSEQLLKQKVGIAGYGNVGRRLVACLAQFGVCCEVFDPLVDLSPIKALAGCRAVHSLEDIMACDIVSLHVPLTGSGPHATRHLLGSPELEQLKPAATLINTSRGAVVDNLALERLFRTVCQ